MFVNQSGLVSSEGWKTAVLWFAVEHGLLADTGPGCPVGHEWDTIGVHSENPHTNPPSCLEEPPAPRIVQFVVLVLLFWWPLMYFSLHVLMFSRLSDDMQLNAYTSSLSIVACNSRK